MSAGLGVSAVAASEDAPYPDVPADAYYAVPVSSLDADGVFVGTLCDEGFCPSEPIGRKTMAVWTVRVLDGADPPAISETRFDDIDADGFHAPFIERMAELGVTRGCGDGSGFCPDRNVTRAEMAVFLSRAYNLPDGPDPGFADVPADAWYAAEVAKLAASEITVGCRDGTVFCPGRHTTRGQMATFLYRAENPNWRDDPSGASPSLAPVMDGGGVIAAGSLHGCALGLDQTITCWGRNEVGQANAPAGRFLAVTAGNFHTCGLRPDQSITCWGSNRGTGGPNVAPANVLGAPSGTFTAIAAGSYHTCGLRTDQSISCWGRDSGFAGSSQTILGAPSGTFLAVAAGENHSCAIRTDGTVTCWGSAFNGELSVPAGRFTSVTAGHSYSCGLRTDQTVACWGGSIGSTPTGMFTAVSAGSSHACGLRTDGTVTCWGGSNLGQPGSPSGVFRAVHAAVVGNTCGLRTDSTVICWGANVETQTIVLGPDDESKHTDDDTALPGNPQNVRVDWWEHHSLTVHWEAPDTGGDVDLYVIDRSVIGETSPSIEGRSGSGSVSSTWNSPYPDHSSLYRNLAVGDNLQDHGNGRYSYVLYLDNDKNHFWVSDLRNTESVRVIATNNNGFAVSDTVTVPSKASEDHQELRSYIEDLVVDNGGAVSWLSEVWSYITARERTVGQGFRFYNKRHTILNAPGFAVSGAEDCDPSKPVECKSVGTVVSVAFDRPISDADEWRTTLIAAHELAHIYTLSTDAPSNPLAIVAGYLYLYHVLSSDPSWEPGQKFGDGFNCSALELYADLGTYLVLESAFPDRPLEQLMSSPYGFDHPLRYWSSCSPGGSKVPSDEALAIARATLGGQVPQWFYDTYQSDDGTFDLDALWTDMGKSIRSSEGAESYTFMLYAMRDRFGGYCNLVNFSGTNPWREGGCEEVRPTGEFTAIMAGSVSSCGLRPDNTVQCWGYGFSQEDALSGLRLTTISRTCGIDLNGNVHCWSGIDPPTGQFTAVSSWGWHACGIKTDGTVGCWDRDGLERPSPPSGQFIAVATGPTHSCGVRLGGTVECWGVHGADWDAPSGAFTDISVGYYFSCGVLLDGAVRCWGRNSYGESDPPSGAFMSVSIGESHACGLRVDGNLACWGRNDHGQTDAPSGSFTAVSAGTDHSCGVRTDGSIACWGDDRYGQAPSSIAP